MLSVENLSCRRGGRIVFRGAGFAIESGGLLLVTGANGSGKSSLLRLLAGLIAPASGNVLWQRTPIDVDRAAHRARLRYIGHLDAAKPQLTVGEMLNYWYALQGMRSKDEDIKASLDTFALGNLISRQVRSLSAGQRRRLGLTRLVLRAAPLWLLDEPTTSLDREGRELLRAQIIRHRAGGGIVIVASHDEIDALDAQHFDIGGNSR